jgi:hypothetical protein
MPLRTTRHLLASRTAPLAGPVPRTDPVGAAARPEVVRDNTDGVLS